MRWYLALILILFLCSVTFMVGFKGGFDAGYIAQESEGLEDCGFYYDSQSNSYVKDNSLYNLNLSNLSK